MPHLPPAAADAPGAHPAVRSFKLRGRIRAGQQTALTDLWPRLGVDAEGGPLDPVALFGRTAPLVVEIGFGGGEATLAMAAADPGRDLPRDGRPPGRCRDAPAWRAGRGADERPGARRGRGAGPARPGGPGRSRRGPGLLSDPWPKARHRKRRLVTPDFVALVASRLRPAGTGGPDDPGGRLHLATDWEPYAVQMLAGVETEPLRTTGRTGPTGSCRVRRTGR